MNDKPHMFKVGDGGCVGCYTDWNPVTVVEVSTSGKTVVVQYDDWRVISGSEHDGSAQYEYTPNLTSLKMKFSLRKNGMWVKVGDTQSGGYRLGSYRRRYYDPHF